MIPGMLLGCAAWLTFVALPVCAVMAAGGAYYVSGPHQVALLGVLIGGASASARIGGVIGWRADR